MQYFHTIGLYHVPRSMAIASIHDDFGNLVEISDDQFDQHYYFNTGIMLLDMAEISVIH